MSVFRRLTSRLRRTGPMFPPPAPLEPVWVIGDIHGCDTLLIRLADMIQQNDITTPDDRLVFVGDYIDRGDNSAQVLEALFAWDQQPNATIMLMGNHEEMMINFLRDPARHGPRWLRYGGLQTLASFGVGGITDTASAEALETAADALRAALPIGLENWLARRPRSWQTGTLTVTHAGADPSAPIELQSDAHLTWGHPDFTKKHRTDGQWVAYGHVITQDLGSDRRGRIATDSGAYATGVLTAVRIDPSGEVFVLQT